MPRSGGSGGSSGARGKHVKGSGATFTFPFDTYTWSRIDQGVDFTGSGGIFAIGDGVILMDHSPGWPNGGAGPSGQGVVYRLDAGAPTGISPSSDIIFVYEGVVTTVRAGQKVKAGDQIAKFYPGSSIEIGFAATASGQVLTPYNGAPDGTPMPAGKAMYAFLKKLEAGKKIRGSGGGGGGSTGGASAQSFAKAAALATFIDLPGILDQAESLALQGERSLMNDQPLLPAVEQFCQASLRSFQSMPNGNFFAFYPDYFGGLSHRTPYWEIHDIEILDGQIQLSDDALATHVYVVGDTMNFDGQVEIFEKMTSAGVVTVFNAFMADFINGVNSPQLQQKAKNKNKTKKDEKTYEKLIKKFPTLADKDNAIQFLKKYGARPLYLEMPMVRSHYYELFLAYQNFCLMWSKQFLSRFEFTFMPELFPGGIISFPDHGIQCYVDEVVHNCDYEAGFTTEANLIAPAALRDKDGKPVDGRRHWINQGMVRAGAFGLPKKKPGGK